MIEYLGVKILNENTIKFTAKFSKHFGDLKPLSFRAMELYHRAEYTNLAARKGLDC